AAQALVCLVHLLLAPGEAHAGRVHDREVGRHRVVQPDEAVVEDANGVLGYDSVGRGHEIESSRGAGRNFGLVVPVLETWVLSAPHRRARVPSLLLGALLDRRAEHHELPAARGGAVPPVGGTDALGVPVCAEARGQSTTAT